MKNIVIVTACPSGVANSIIAAGLLKQASEKLNIKASIECQSTVLPVNVLTAADIAAADAIIIATNSDIDTSRFVGKKVYQGAIADCTAAPQAWLDNAINTAQELTAAKVSKGAIIAATNATSSSVKKIVAITACPTGVAHTFMAAEALESEAKRQGHIIKVETRGSVGAKNQLTAQDIAEADLVIIAADIEVPMGGFNGKRLYKTSTSLALKKTQQEINKAFAEASIFEATGNDNSSQSGEKKGVYKHLMTGVSHMLPVVIAGGLLIALSFVFGIEAFKEKGTIAATLMDILVAELLLH